MMIVRNGHTKMPNRFTNVAPARIQKGLGNERRLWTNVDMNGGGNPAMRRCGTDASNVLYTNGLRAGSAAGLGSPPNRGAVNSASGPAVDYFLRCDLKNFTITSGAWSG
jgi:hypothetical protein